MSLSLLLPSVSSAKKIKKYKLELKEDARLVLIKGPIHARMADPIVEKIYNYDMESNQPIYYLINTNGGSFSAGTQIIRAMTSADSPSICVVDRAAYSMGALILTHCDTAYIYKDASVMFHEGYLGIQGRLSEVFSYIDFEKKEFDKLNKEIAGLLKMKVDDYIAKQKDEWWLTAEDTVEIGLAKGIITKLYYPLSADTSPPPFFILFSSSLYQEDRDGHLDLTYYPDGNPYDPSRAEKIFE
jgi:ATP-dependent protease ClpP protease subunit